MRRRSFSECPASACTAASTGRPTVSVPVLSSTIASRWASRSSASPPLKSTPSCAPRPTATVSAAGTANPMAQGQAITSTATVLASASGSECAAISQDTKVSSSQTQHHGHKDGTGAVGQPLHGRARALRLLHHARNLRQHRCLAQRLSAANHSAVVVERAGQHAAARLAAERRGFAGKHRFVHGGAAFQNGRVHREALTGKNQNAVAGLNLGKRHNRLNAVHDAARSHGPQPGERVERGQCAALGAALQALAQKQKPKNQQNRVKVDLASGRGPQRGIRRSREKPRPCPARPACSCWWLRGAGRGWRSGKCRDRPTRQPLP